MNTLEDIASLSREELLVLMAEQQRQIIQLHGQLAEATTTIKTLQVEVGRLKREQKRQAAPFSKGTRVRQPKRPGRKPGSGTFSFRLAPKPEKITEPPVEVTVVLEACPGCGGRLEEERVELAYITDLH
jgi:transposase